MAEVVADAPPAPLVVGELTVDCMVAAVAAVAADLLHRRAETAVTARRALSSCTGIPHNTNS